MFCTNCGTEISGGFCYCPQCGASTGKTGAVPPAGRPRRPLVRPREDRKIAGVCAGIADYLGMDVTLVRILVVCLSIWPPGVGLIFYIVCWIVVPNEPLYLAPPVDRIPVDPTGTAAGQPLT